MYNISIISDNQDLVMLWSKTLSGKYLVTPANKVALLQQKPAVVIIDTQMVDENPELINSFSQQSIRSLIIGSEWQEEKQITALVQGASGYCDESASPELLIKAIESIIKGDIWIQRHLVPKVIGALVQIKNAPLATTASTPSPESSEQFSTLSKREHDVAKMIRNGENNKKIASAMNISERTVKAHLTSIFRKLNISDRLHLALFIKEFD